ncbi:MAG: ABC transporter permease [Vicinamibacterales bacterium]
MNALLSQLQINLRLYFRNTMALVYGYLFPAIFLLAFWVLYRYERVPLVRHMGELLTIAVLGGACFGLPTTMVSERERGVWRRYRLTPVPTLTLVGSTLLARYVILITAGLLQVGLAMSIGMPLPHHPLQLFIVFSCVAFAFMGLGLVIATLADNVPAVQALGQCIFLPMLIIGGVAVQLSSLPDWALHLSAFFPGRYAVGALQAAVTGGGLHEAAFDVIALLAIGTAGSIAGAGMFRWDAQQRFRSNPRKGWLAVALAAWILTGAAAEGLGRVALPAPPSTVANPVNAQAPANPPPAAPAAVSAPPAQPNAVPPVVSGPDSATAPASGTAARGSGERRAAESPVGRGGPAAPGAPTAGVSPPNAVGSRSSAEGPTPKPPATPASSPEQLATPAAWQAVTLANIEADLTFTRLPSDSGVVTPVAAMTQDPDPDVLDDLETIRTSLPEWGPAKVTDPLQRVRNLLLVAAVPDVFQMPIEPFVPWVVFAEIQRTVPKDDLMKILYWIALHPADGSNAAVEDLPALGIVRGRVDIEEARNRAAVYAVKLLGQLTGKRPAR